MTYHITRQHFGMNDRVFEASERHLSHQGQLLANGPVHPGRFPYPIILLSLTEYVRYFDPKKQARSYCHGCVKRSLSLVTPNNTFRATFHSAELQKQTLNKLVAR